MCAQSALYISRHSRHHNLTIFTLKIIADLRIKFMYIHLGNNKVIREKEIIGIFDLDTATVSKRTRDYLEKAEKSGNVTYDSFELPKSFIVCAEKKGENRVFLSQLSTTTLQKRKLANSNFKTF